MSIEYQKAGHKFHDYLSKEVDAYRMKKEARLNLASIGIMNKGGKH